MTPTGTATPPPPTAEDYARLERQVAQLMRALMRVRGERDTLAKQVEALQAQAGTR